MLGKDTAPAGLLDKARGALAWVLGRHGSLQHRVARGGVWMVFGDLASRFSGLIRLAVLGRLLGPQDFGLFGIALTLQSWITAFSQTGVALALIQRPGDITAHLNTAWTIQMMRGTAIFAVTWGVSPWAAAFFRSPESAPIIAAIGLVPLVRGFSNPAVVCLPRDLHFKEDASWRLWGPLAGLVSGVVLAFWLRSVWALVGSVITAQVAETAASYWVKPYLPRFSWNREKFSDLLRFAKWVFWVDMEEQLYRQVDSLVVGRWIGTQELGFYQVGRQVSYLALTGLGVQVSGVLFPAFSKIATPELARAPMLRAVRALLTLLLPLVVSVSFFTDILIAVMVGSKWEAAAPVAAILSWAGLARLIGGVPTACLKGLGMPSKLLRSSLIRLAVAVGGLALFAQDYGLLGVSAAISISAAVWALDVFASCARVLRLGGLELIKTALPGLLFSAPICATVVLAPDLRGTLGLAVAALACGAAAYALLRQIVIPQK